MKRGSRTPVVVVFGLPGSGKSFFAKRLADRMAAQYLSSDELRRRMFDRRTYSAEEKAAVYEAMTKHMNAALDQNRPVVLDATFHRRDTRRAVVDAIGQRGEVYFIEVRAEESVIRRRLEKDRPYSEADFDVYELIRDNFEPLETPHLILESTNDNIEDMMATAERYLVSVHNVQ